MPEIKIYECAICKRLAKRGVKGETRFRGTRQDVRKHLREVHKIKGQKNRTGMAKKDFGQSDLTSNTITEVFN